MVGHFGNTPLKAAPALGKHVLQVSSICVAVRAALLGSDRPRGPAWSPPYSRAPSCTALRHEGWIEQPRDDWSAYLNETTATIPRSNPSYSQSWAIRHGCHPGLPTCRVQPFRQVRSVGLSLQNFCKNSSNDTIRETQQPYRSSDTSILVAFKEVPNSSNVNNRITHLMRAF